MGKHELLQEWIDRGHNDFRSADYLSTMHHPTPDEIICYLCQQSAEKYLKAFLFLHDVEPPKIHDLNELLEMIAEVNPGIFKATDVLYTLSAEYEMRGKAWRERVIWP